MKHALSSLKRGMLAACLVAVTPVATLAADVTIRLGHVLPESHSWHIAASGFAQDVTERTEGRVQIEVFPSGQLGSEKGDIEGLLSILDVYRK